MEDAFCSRRDKQVLKSKCGFIADRAENVGQHVSRGIPFSISFALGMEKARVSQVLGFEFSYFYLTVQTLLWYVSSPSC